MTIHGRAATAAVLALAMAAAAALRAWTIAAWPLWLDESWSRWLAGQGWHDLVAKTLRLDVHLPLYYGLLKLWTAVAPDSPAGLRLLSVLAGTAIVPLAWAAARQIPRLRAEPWLPLLAAGLAAFSPPLMIAARQARPYAVFALAFALALFLALRLLRGRDKALGLWIGYGAALELVLWLHNLGILFAAALLLGLLIGLRTRARLAAFLATHAVVGLLYIPAFLAILEQKRTWTSTWLRFVPGDVPAGLAEGLAAPGAIALVLFLLALVGAAALLRGREDRPAALLLVSAAFLPAALTLLASLVSAPIFLPRTLAPCALPFLILVAAGAAAVTREALRRGLAAAALLFLGLSSAALATAPPEEKWDALGAWLAPRVAASEEVWLLPNELVLPFRYANPGFARPLRGAPADFPAPDHKGPRYSGTMAVPGMTATDAATLAADARRRGVTGIWVVSRFPAIFDPNGTLPPALGPAGPLEVRFAPIGVRHYALR